jgi:predicted XRE-type DNA-binding protein
MSLEFSDAVVLCLKRNKRLGVKPASQTDIAEHFGLSKPYVNQLINGNVADTANTRHWTEEIKKYVGFDK